MKGNLTSYNRIVTQFLTCAIKWLSTDGTHFILKFSVYTSHACFLKLRHFFYSWSWNLISAHLNSRKKNKSKIFKMFSLKLFTRATCCVSLTRGNQSIFRLRLIIGNNYRLINDLKFKLFSNGTELLKWWLRNILNYKETLESVSLDTWWADECQWFILTFLNQ